MYGFYQYTDDFTLFGGDWAFGSKTIGFCYLYEPDNDPTFGLWNVCDSPAYVYSH